MSFSPQDVSFFETFGFIKLPGALAGDLAWIEPEFAQVFLDRGIIHDGSKQSGYVPFIDSRERLATLLDHPAILDAAKALLGENFNYLSSDGNYYKGDTPWHPDGDHQVGKYIKVAIYLDRVRRENGALQVFPRSHRLEKRWDGEGPGNAERLWGRAQSELPSVALDSDPGDVLIFNHNLMHGSFGGSAARRMFTLNLGAEANTPEEIEELKAYLRFHNSPWGERVHSEIMRQTAGPERMKHLRQVFDYEYVLPEERKQKEQAKTAAAMAK